MPRKVFLSFRYRDRAQVAGFNLLRYSKLVAFKFTGRHLLRPVNSVNPSYIRRKIREKLKFTSVTVVLLGKTTHRSGWVAREIRDSIAKGNGVVAIDLKGQTPSVPAGSPVGAALRDAGAERIGWKPHTFHDAIERAAAAVGRGAAIEAHGGAGGGSCSR